MPTGYDLLEHSHEFRIHVLRRLAAALIDVVLIFIPVILILLFLRIEPIELMVGVLSGFCWFFYSTIFESTMSATLGKKVMSLLVVSTDNPMNLSKGIVRNVPKMFWFIFLPVDVFVGFAVASDPRQRWTDKIANTVVIKK